MNNKTNIGNQKFMDELRDVSPFLAKLKAEKTEFAKPNIPAQYFDKLTENIFEQTILQPKPVQNRSQPKGISNFERLFQWLLQPNFAMLSMAIVLFIVAGVYLVNNPQTDEMNVEFTAAEIESFVEDNIESFDFEQLADLVILEENDPTNFIEIPAFQENILEEYFEESLLEDITIDDLM